MLQKIIKGKRSALVYARRRAAVWPGVEADFWSLFTSFPRITFQISHQHHIMTCEGGPELASTSSRLTPHAPFSIQERPAASEGRCMCVTQTAPGQSIHSSTPPTHGGSPIDANLPAPVRFPVAPFSRMLGEICLWPRGLVVCWSGGPVAPRAVNQPY